MAYNQMAYVYDKLMAHAPYDKWAEFTRAAVTQSRKQIEHIADLGCGTGEITTKLAELGFRMTGLDYSTEMLTYAEHKASEEDLRIQWMRQDLREMQGLNNLDAAISYCDVINYITTEQELRNVFNRVVDALKDGGLFIFDVHSMYHVEHHLINQTFADVTEDASYIWFCSEGDMPGEMHHDLTFFALNGEKYERFDEYHHQRTYSISFFQEILLDAGFENIKIYADFTLKNEFIDEKAERIFFLAEKRSG
ncbi:class I SAM-dependent methyltransferase [Virgibacillus sp. NKC19-16]|uniref:class I SAM-dependent DNA methyltransferase n=1 Tax=Virgibacillus salidurans TaxID=2831673 RepID=UPI001F3F6880|nr:class I SAM-dependent methyltransferase [Virgibacillus sp. NKC19-16]UJL44899.1 class I SAM-dependent methyltransferase [Virgibacillus sp. NKC19-16]